MKGRIVGIDVARFVALAGMMAVHILPGFQGDQATVSQQVAGGRASALFAVLAGVSISVATGGAAVTGRRWTGVAAGLVVRGLLIGLLGLALGEVDTTIAVILCYYAVLFVLGAPFVACSTRVLWVAATAWVVLGPVLSHLLRESLAPGSGQSPTFDYLKQPGQLLQELLLTGIYPCLVWLAYLLVGLAVGRLPLRRWRTAGWLAGVGGLLVLASYLVSDWLLDLPGVRDELALGAGGRAALELELSGGMHGTTPENTWWWLAVRAAHSGTPLDLAQTIGSALVVLALGLVLGLLAPRPMAVLFGAGAMTLTLYSVHVLSRQPGWWDGGTGEVWLGQVLVALSIGGLYGLFGTKGPLERVVGAASGAARRLAGGVPEPSSKVTA